MADAERCDYKEDILPKKDSVLDMIRVATYIHQIPTALEMVKDAHDKGYETTVNLMAASTIPDDELTVGLEMLAQSEARAIYVVDSFGAFYGEQIRALVKKYFGYCKASGKDVGMHMHNNMQLAFANTIEGIIEGANFLDATMAGLGRGAGNCPMELLLAFLHNPKYQLRPVLQCVQNHVEPMRAKLLWGYDLPYLLTGMLNQHPRTAIKFKEAELKGEKGDILKFHDTVTIRNEPDPGGRPYSTASTQRPQSVGCSAFWPMSDSQCQQRSHFCPSALETVSEHRLAADAPGSLRNVQQFRASSSRVGRQA